MNIKEIKSITKEVINNSLIDSSSDFIMVAYELHKKFYEGLSEKMECILMIEGENHHNTWAANCVFVEDNLVSLDHKDIYDCMIAYRMYLDYFLNDEVISAKYFLDEEDHIGWKIYKELDTKYNWCRKRLLVLDYIKEAQTC